MLPLEVIRHEGDEPNDEAADDDAKRIHNPHAKRDNGNDQKGSKTDDECDESQFQVGDGHFQKSKKEIDRRIEKPNDERKEKIRANVGHIFEILDLHPGRHPVNEKYNEEIEKKTSEVIHRGKSIF